MADKTDRKNDERKDDPKTAAARADVKVTDAADDKQRPVTAGQGAKIDNSLPPEHPGAAAGAQPPDNRRATEPQPEMRNEDRRSAPNPRLQTVRVQDRPAIAPEPAPPPTAADLRRETRRSEVTGEMIVSEHVGDRGPDNLTGGIVTESRQSGAVVTNEQRAGAMPESSRRANEEAEAEADERATHSRAGTGAGVHTDRVAPRTADDK